MSHDDRFTLSRFRSDLYQFRKAIRSFAKECDEQPFISWDIDFYPREFYPICTIYETPCPEHLPFNFVGISSQLNNIEQVASPLRELYWGTVSEFLESLQNRELNYCAMYKPNEIMEVLEILDEFTVHNTKP